jgi:hypothetical protein
MGHPAENKAESTTPAESDNDRVIGGGPPPSAGNTPMDDLIDLCCEFYPIWKRNRDQQCDSKDNG